MAAFDDPAYAERLWELSEQMIGARFMT